MIAIIVEIIVMSPNIWKTAYLPMSLTHTIGVKIKNIIIPYQIVGTVIEAKKYTIASAFSTINTI
jgi:hypothetical protein